MYGAKEPHLAGSATAANQCERHMNLVPIITPGRPQGKRRGAVVSQGSLQVRGSVWRSFSSCTIVHSMRSVNLIAPK